MKENDLVKKITGRRMPVLVVLLLLSFFTAANATTRYVTPTGAGSKNGSSWGNASDDIQAMINVSVSGDSVWVMMGTYLPTHSAVGWTESVPTGVNANPKDRHNAFVLKTGVKVYGGFVGNETGFSQRDWINNRTILSGDFDNNDYLNDSSHSNSQENAYHVIITVNTGLGTVLDGFTIWGGNHYNEYNINYDLVSITTNGVSVANRMGGGIHANNSAVLLSNLEIRRNAAFNGAGLYCVNSSDLRGNNLYFFKNFAAQGGGIYVGKCSPKFKNIILSENEAGSGAGVSNSGGYCTPHYTNVLIHSNYGSPHNGSGAGIQNEVASPVLTNATIVGNFGGVHAGMYNYYNCSPIVNNSIIWNNKAANVGWTHVYVDNVKDDYDCVTTYNNSLLQYVDLTASGGLNAAAPGFDPMFISPPGYKPYDGFCGSFTLEDGSPCINTGSDSLYQAVCGTAFQGWENEYALTPPPFHTNPNSNFFGGAKNVPGWYPTDKYSGRPALRRAGNGINIGAFEEIIDSIPPPQPCITRYVTPPGNGLMNGTSWSNASNDIQAMINISESCDTVWVAAGTYKPTHSAAGWTEKTPTGVNINPNDQQNAFIMKTGVKVFGGFIGNETKLEQRNQVANRSVLSGDFNGNDNGTKANDATHAENAHHVVISAGTGSDAELNGFTISGGGYFTNFTDLAQDARTVAVNGETVRLRDGGGIHIVNSALLLQNLEIKENGGRNGAGIYCGYSSEARGYNLQIHRNSGRSGGGIGVINSNAKFKNLTVSQNSALYGGGISNEVGVCKPNYINLMLVDNQADFYNGCGAGMLNNTSNPVITNATIICNYGGYCAGILNSENAHPIVNNSIIWNNSALPAATWSGYIDNIGNWNGSSITYKSSLLQYTDLSSTGGLNATVPGFDPKFTGAGGLYENSPCVDAADSALYKAACGSEFLGWKNEYTLTPAPFILSPRFSGAGIDLGAFEYYFAPPPPCVTRYVTQTGAGLMDGSSWNNASNNIQAMINISKSCDEVWVAEGIYTPTHSAAGWTESAPTGVNANPNDRNNAFVLKTGVKVYGGFAGGETDTGQRNWFDNRTILSGDFAGNDVVNDPAHANSAENAYHIIITANTGAGTVLDGFTIRGGNYYGYHTASSMTVNGITVGSDNGGGIYANKSKAFLKNLEIRRNAAPNVGGGLYCANSSDLRGENLYFYRNFASQGGGMFIGSCNPKFKNIILADNQAGVGAGVSNSGSNPHYTNVLIHSNIGSPINGHGAGMQNEVASPVLTNVTIVGNYGGINAAGIYNYYNCFPVVNNSIIWNNRIGSGICNVKDDYDCYTTYNHSLLQGADLSATGGLNANVSGFDPMFISPPGNVLLAPIGSFTLDESSPCIGAGDPLLYEAALGDEFQGWGNEIALTPPPYTTWKSDFVSSYFGTWYPKDDYSGVEALRLYNGNISIGAFEISDVGGFRSGSKPVDEESRMEREESNAGSLQLFPNPIVSGASVKIVLPDLPTGNKEVIGIYSIARLPVLQLPLPSESQTFETTINLPPGYYILKWRTFEAKLMVK